MFLRDIHELDPVIPTRITAVPESLRVLHDPRLGPVARVQLEIYDMHYRKFDWTADVPTSVQLASNNTDHARKYTVSLKLNTVGYSEGWHPLAMTITARRRNGILSNIETLSVPITLYLGRLDTVFLPIIRHAAH